MDPKTQRLLDAVAQTLFDKRGINILALDVRGVCSLTDVFLIAEGGVDRHVRALAKAVMKCLEEEGCELVHLEGGSSGEWMVLDYSDLIVHLFIPELREKYALEELWHEGKIIDLTIEIHEREQHG